jgi:hypothetical protein
MRRIFHDLDVDSHCCAGIAAGPADDLQDLGTAEPSMVQRQKVRVLLREVEAGNDRLGALIGRLIGEGAEFDGLMNSAQSLMTTLRQEAAALPAVAARLDAPGTPFRKTSPGAGEQVMLDDLFSRYTMERERDVHRKYLGGLGIAPPKTAAPVIAEADDGVLLF